jgi:diaminopimelate decarboxylase
LDQCSDIDTLDIGGGLGVPLVEDILLPPIQEGDYLALLNVGGYGSASSSNHCMRGKFSEYLLVE